MGLLSFFQRQQQRGFGGIMERAQQPIGQGALTPLDMVMGGMSLMGAAQPFGGGWGTAAQNLSGLVNTAQQRQRQRRQDEREETVWGRQQTEWDRADQERAQRQQRYAQALQAAQGDPELLAAIQAVGPEGVAELMAGQVMSPFQRESLGLQRDQIRMALAEHEDTMRLGYARLGQDRMLNSALAGLGRDEAAYIAGMRGRLDTGADVMQDINELDTILQRNPRIFGSLLEPDVESAIRKFGARGDERAIADIQRVWSIAAGLARDELRGQTPVSNLDLRTAIQTGPSTTQMPLAVSDWIRSARADYARVEQQYQSALSYMQGHGNLYSPSPESGRNWYQDNYTNFRPYVGTGVTDPNLSPGRGGTGRGGGRTPSPEEAQAELARRSGTGAQARAPQTPLEQQIWSSYMRARQSGNPSAAAHWEQRARRAGLLR